MDDIYDSNNRKSRGEQITMGNYDPPMNIESVLFFKLGINESRRNNVLSISPAINGFSQEKISGNSPDQTRIKFREILNKYITGDKSISQHNESEPPTDPRRTRISLHANSSCYIVIELDSMVSWNFAEFSTPFSTVLDAGSGNDGGKIFTTPSLCLPNNSGNEAIIERVIDLRTANKNSISRWACFVFNENEVNRLDSGAAFSVGFNIHIDLIPEGPNPRAIPITIDPDVGHPGGQGYSVAPIVK